jgi:hypothetical protein
MSERVYAEQNSKGYVKKSVLKSMMALGISNYEIIKELGIEGYNISNKNMDYLIKNNKEL